MQARWNATVTYRSDLGPIEVEHSLSEIGDIENFVEAGPHWDTIEKIEIVRVNHNTSVTLTVEQARAL